MTRLLGTLLVTALLLIGCAGDRLHAQQPVVTQPYLVQSTNNSSTIQSTNVFQSVFLLSGAQKRAACTIANYGANTMFVYFGPIASATKATSVQLAANQSTFCNNSGVTLQDQVSITGTSGDAFFAAQQ